MALSAEVADWAALRTRVKPGVRLQVVGNNLASHEAELVSIDEADLVLTDRKFAREEVVRVSLARQRRRNALIGLGIGAAVGIGVGVLVTSALDGTTSDLPAVVGACMGILAGVGALTGAALPADRTLYRRPAAAPPLAKRVVSGLQPGATFP